MVRERDAPPHVRDRAVVEAEPFLRLLEVAADDVHERIDRHLRRSDRTRRDRSPSPAAAPCTTCGSAPSCRCLAMYGGGV